MARNNVKKKNCRTEDIESPVTSRSTRKNNRNSKYNTGNSKSGGRTPTANDGRNDFSWYNQNPALVQASARVPYPYRPGLSMPAAYNPMLAKEGETSTVSYANEKVPGICVLSWVPFVGVSKDVTSPISLAARDLFSRVRSAFSGSITVDAPDFIMHIMAMDSIYAYIAWLRRIYRTLNTFSYNNTLTPEALLRAMGLSDKQIDDLKRDRTHLFGVVNELTSMTQRFFVPDLFPIIHRHVWMSERVYCDAPSANSQMYLFNPESLLQFSVDSQGAGQLTEKRLVLDPPTAVKRTADLMMDFGKEMIQAVSNWDDGYIINGYLQKAFESDKSFFMDQVQYGELLDLNYNEVVLGQIENAVACPAATNGTTQYAKVSITQDPTTNAILSDCQVRVETVGELYNMLSPAVNRLSSRMDAPSEENTIENSRLITRWAARGITGQPYLTVTSAGTEVVTNIHIQVFSNNDWRFINVNNAIMVVNMQTGETASVAINELDKQSQIISTLANFDWHPIVPAGTVKLTTNGSKVDRAFNIGYLGDIHNLTFVDHNSMDYINRCCLYSEFSSFTLNK